MIETRDDLNRFLDPALYPLDWRGIENLVGSSNAEGSARPEQPKPTLGPGGSERRLSSSEADMDVDHMTGPGSSPLSSISDDGMSSTNSESGSKSTWPAPPVLDSMPSQSTLQKDVPRLTSLPNFKPLDSYLAQTVAAMDEALKNHAFRDVPRQSNHRAMLETLAQIVNVEAKIEREIGWEIENVNQESFNVQLTEKVVDNAESKAFFPNSHSPPQRSSGSPIHPAGLLSPTVIDGKSESFDPMGFRDSQSSSSTICADSRPIRLDERTPSSAGSYIASRIGHREDRLLQVQLKCQDLIPNLMQ